MQSTQCTIPGCSEPKKQSRRLCLAHCLEFAKAGKSSRRTAEDRFWAKVAQGDPDECWLWSAALDGDGYGGFWLDGKDITAQRASYLLFVGPIGEGMEIDHLCNVRNCVNPDHLEQVTKAENGRRAGERQTHCANGHEYTEANTYRFRGNRQCRACTLVKVECPECSAVLSRTNMSAHRKSFHS